MRAQNINKIMRVGIYHRLSVKDSNSNESESIANQRRITSDYVKKRGWILVEEYSDDGYAGSDFARPGFLALTKAIEAGLIDCVIVKDHSRLGRDVQLCNYYRETYFPNHNTRYIAIIDNFDSYNQRESSIDIEAIKDVINEAKLREISISTRRTKATNGALGMFMNNIPPFGYTLSAEDKHKFVIDPYAASIVRRIFELYNSGENMRRIAGILNAEGIVNPREYYYRRIDKPNPFTTQSKAWSTNTIGQMLKNRAYVGDMVSGKRVNATYKRDCKRISIPEDEQTVVENMHEPIVSREDFLRAKELREKHAHRQTRKGNKPPYTLGGLVFCGQCGAPLAPAVNGGKTTKRAYYRCTRHNIYGNGVCANSRNFPEKLLNEVVLNDLRLLAEKASKNKQELVDEVIAMNRSRSRDEVSSAAERAKALQAEHDKANMNMSQLLNTPGRRG